MAVAHSLLIAIFIVLSGKTFKDLGADYYTNFNRATAEITYNPNPTDIKLIGEAFGFLLLL